MAQTGYPLSVMHGYRIATEDALDFASLLDRLSPSSLEGIEDISRARRETVPFGALILERLVRLVKPSEVMISVFGVREGMLYSLLDEAERARDPLLSACEELAAMRSRSPAHARELTRWTDALFVPPGPDETQEERRLRHAACLLSDVEWRAHPDYRGEKSLNTIAHGSFAGIDHPGRAYLALAVYYRHMGLMKEEQSPRLIELTDDRMRKRARILGAAIRAAHMLSAAMPGVVGHAPVSFQDGKLVLSLPERFHVLDGERLQRRFATLARELDREPEIRLIDSPQRVAV
jgi:exopolyphosphatase/guanosine-5'-triphosphate,3'-diphosphate pyrophosphatase